MASEYVHWREIPADSYFSASLALSDNESTRLQAALAVLPSNIIDAHTHAARDRDVRFLSRELLCHLVSTFPTYSLEMAAAAKRVLWPGKQVRSARMAHAVVGYDHTAINAYLKSEIPAGDFFIAFGLSSSPPQVERLLAQGGVAALKMYFHSVDPPHRTIMEVFPESVLRAAEAAHVPIILHLPTSLPDSIEEVSDIANRFPQLSIILAHLGGHGGHSFTPQHPAAFRAIAELPTVCMDTALVLDRDLVNAAIEALGPDRILFGTDEPLSLIRATPFVHQHLGSRLFAPYYHWSRDSDIPEQVRHHVPILLHILMLEAITEAVDHDQQSLQKIFHDNALRLFERGT